MQLLFFTVLLLPTFLAFCPFSSISSVPDSAQHDRLWLEPLLCYGNAPCRKEKLSILLVSLVG